MPQKLLKLLIDDYQIALESATGVIGGDEWEDESEGESGDEGGDDDLFASLIGGDIGALCEMENEQSEFADDPLMLMDWKVTANVHVKWSQGGTCTQAHCTTWYWLKL